MVKSAVGKLPTWAGLATAPTSSGAPVQFVGCLVFRPSSLWDSGEVCPSSLWDAGEFLPVQFVGNRLGRSVPETHLPVQFVGFRPSSLWGLFCILPSSLWNRLGLHPSSLWDFARPVCGVLTEFRDWTRSA